MARFCPRCQSLVPPGRSRCINCGCIVDSSSESKQKNLEEMFGGSLSHDDEEDRYEDFDLERELEKAQEYVSEPPKTVDAEDMKAPYLPYEPRANQLQIINDIRSAMDAGRHIVIESGTGTGKTIVSLAAALEHSIPRGKKIIYLTRTISQSDQVMRELKAISSLKEVTGICITGRARSCPLLRSLPGHDTMPPQVLSSICEEKKSRKSCMYFNSLRDKMADVEHFCRMNFPKSEELDSYCVSIGTCPYEMKKLLMKGVNVVVAPYVHILSEDIRSNLLRNMDVEDDQVTIVIDEAHNLIDAAREQESFRITKRMVDAALDECSTIRGGDAGLCDGVSIRPFITHLRNIMRSLANEKLGLNVTEALLAPDDVEMKIFSKFAIDRSRLNLCIDMMQDIGEERTDKLLERGENRVSDIFTLAVALRGWMLSPDDKYIRAIKASDEGEYLQAACINPSDVTSFLRKRTSVLHMSGTLQPLEQYIRVMGLPPGTITKVYPSPFPRDNKKVVYMGNVTTHYKEMKEDPSMFSRIERNLAKICNSVDKNTLVFFPSYGLMNRMKEFLIRDVHRNIYWEVQKHPKETMNALNQFRKGRDGVFFTVMGGNISEGIDFPGDELCFAVIVGIPFPPPTLENKAMSDMFDRKYGPWMGWRYTSLTPAMRKMKQAIGRLIRTETDRGMAVIMDSRMSKYGRELEATLTKDPMGDAARFFEQK